MLPHKIKMIGIPRVIAKEELKVAAARFRSSIQIASCQISWDKIYRIPNGFDFYGRDEQPGETKIWTSEVYIKM